jgi:DNA-binding NtrC family response regulator
MRTVLVVDDKEMMRDSVASTLQRAGFTVVTASDGNAGIEAVMKRRPDAVVTDMKMPGMTGVEMLEKIRQIDDDLPVVLMTAFGTIETAVKAMRLGAFDYLTKPFEGDELIICIKRAIEHRRVVRENAVLKAATNGTGDGGAESAARRTGLDRIVGVSPAIHTLRDQIVAVANSHGTVLITGESGVGKEVVARAVHEMSPRKDGAFLAVNCAALSPSLLESELFGHERGAFTGAERLRKGRFELADQGTLLLDEVSEIDPQIQAKLLRVLQERSFERVGSSASIGVDVRIVATSNRDLPHCVEKGEFRRDLYYRLNVLPIAVPSLRERAEDVEPLAEHFVREVCRREGRATLRIHGAAIERLRAYSWPGNVRELQNICERAVVLTPRRDEGEQGVITRELVEPWLTASGLGVGVVSGAAQMLESKPSVGVSGAPGSGNERRLEDIEREAILTALEKFKGHRQRTALALGIGVRTLGLKLKRWKELQLVAESV